MISSSANQIPRNRGGGGGGGDNENDSDLLLWN